MANLMLLASVAVEVSQPSEQVPPNPAVMLPPKPIVTKNNRVVQPKYPKEGVWSGQEHHAFCYAYCLFGNDWGKVANYMYSLGMYRKSSQVRSHAQKWMKKMRNN